MSHHPGRRGRRAFAPLLAAVVTAAGGLFYAANPYRSVPTTTTETRTDALAPPGGHAEHVGYCTTLASWQRYCPGRTGFAGANLSADRAYPGEPIYLALETASGTEGTIPPAEVTTASPTPSVHVQVDGAEVHAVWPVATYVWWLQNRTGDQTIAFSPAPQSPGLASLPACVSNTLACHAPSAFGAWVLSYAQPGDYTVAVGFPGTTDTMTVRVLPFPAGVSAAKYPPAQDPTIPLGLTWRGVAVRPFAPEAARQTALNGAEAWTHDATWRVTGRTNHGSIDQSGTISLGQQGPNVPWQLHSDESGQVDEAYHLAAYPPAGSPDAPWYMTLSPLFRAGESIGQLIAGFGVPQATYMATVTRSTSILLLSALWRPGAVLWPWGSRPRDWRWLVLAGSLAAAFLALAPWRRRRRGTAGNVQMETTEAEAPAAEPEAPEKGPTGGDEP